MSDVTRLLSEIESGDSTAAEQLLPLVYDELRKLAASKLSQENPGQTLQATALVHEAWLRLVGSDGSEQSWDSRGHFFAAAAESMRRILVDQARRKNSEKRGRGRRQVKMEDTVSLAPDVESSLADLLSLNEALDQLEAIDPQKAQLVKLRYFAGLTLDEAALATGVSVATAKRQWVYARAWLYGKLADE